MGHYRLIVANLYAGALRELFARFADHAEPRGWLIVSGLLEADRDAVREAAVAEDWEPKSERCLEGWTRSRCGGRPEERHAPLSSANRGASQRMRAASRRRGSASTRRSPSASGHSRGALRRRGGSFLAELSSIGPSAAELNVLGAIERQTESALSLTLAVAIAKGPKLDWVVEKATELGASRFLPFTSERTIPERRDFAERVRRWRRIASAAVAQCGRAVCPEVRDVDEFRRRTRRQRRMRPPTSLLGGRWFAARSSLRPRGAERLRRDRAGRWIRTRRSRACRDRWLHAGRARTADPPRRDGGRRGRHAGAVSLGRPGPVSGRRVAWCVVSNPADATARSAEADTT